MEKGSEGRLLPTIDLSPLHPTVPTSGNPTPSLRLPGFEDEYETPHEWRSKSGEQSCRLDRVHPDTISQGPTSAATLDISG
jgi:hypothetical protein